jgi:hypothetical protein
VIGRLSLVLAFSRVLNLASYAVKVRLNVGVERDKLLGQVFANRDSNARNDGHSPCRWSRFA